jgi:hypothetical protein
MFGCAGDPSLLITYLRRLAGGFPLSIIYSPSSQWLAVSGSAHCCMVDSKAVLRSGIWSACTVHDAGGGVFITGGSCSLSSA